MRSSSAAQTFDAPKQIEEYRLIHQLGFGATGEVYLAEDTYLRRLVAIKFLVGGLPPQVLQEDLLREARAAARVVHPNVVQIFRVNVFCSVPYLVTEYLRGQSLRELAKPVSPQDLLRLSRDILRGLSAVHRMQILHRDVKPANIMLTEDGVIKLLDFGLAKVGPAIHVAPPTAIHTSTASCGVTDASPLDTTVSARVAPSKALPSVPTQSQLGPQSTLSVPSARQGAGTPLYMAPEVWKEEPATIRSDLYSTAVVLYELATGERPFRGASVPELGHAVQQAPLTPIRKLAPNVSPRIASAIERALSRNPSERPSSTEEFLSELEEPTQNLASTPPALDTPFRGLFPFEAEHRAVFFGRSRDIESIVELLRSEQLVTVVGDSGVGKSSLCRAGVLPRIDEGALDPQRKWQMVSLSPGRRPVLTLADALAPVLERETTHVFSMLHEEPEQVLRWILYSLSSQRGLLLYFDQLEELVTESAPIEALAIGEFIACCANRLPGLRILTSVRSDYLVRVLEHTDLREQLTRGVHLLRPLGPQDLREVIVGPVSAMGYRFESDRTVTEMIDACGSEGGSLPLLQFALFELWRVRDAERKVIPQDGLGQIGGVKGALKSHADGAYQRLLPSEKQAARWMLTAMVHADNTRAALSEDELTTNRMQDQTTIHAALEALIRGRLVHAQQGIGNRSSYQLAHEALVREWTLLRDWLSNDQERRELEAQLRTAAAEWKRLGQPKDELWGDRRLQEVKQFGIDRGVQCAMVQSFLRASERNAKQKQRRAMVVGVLLVIGVMSAGGFWVQRREAQKRELLLRAARLSNAIQRDGASTKATIREALELLDESEKTKEPATKAVLQKAVFDVATAGGSMGMLDLGAKIESVDFTPDDRQVLIASGTKTWFWTLTIPRTPPKPVEHGALVRYAGYFPSGTQVLSVAEDGTARVAKPEQSTWLRTLRAPKGRLRFALPFCSDAQVVGTDDQGKLLFYTENQLSKTVELGAPADRLLTNPSCQRVLIKTAKHVLIYTPATDRLDILHTLEEKEEIPALDMSTDGRFVAMTGPKGSIRLVDLGASNVNHNQTRMLPVLFDQIRLLRFQPHTSILLSASLAIVVPLWEIPAGSIFQRLRGQSANTTDAIFSEDGSRIATSHSDGSVRIWDVNSGSMIAFYQHGANPETVQFSHNTRLLVTTGKNGHIRLWDAWAGAITLYGEHKYSVRSAEISRDNRRVLTAASDGTAHIWDIATGRNIHILRHAVPGDKRIIMIPVAHFSHDGSKIVTVGWDGRAILWSGLTGNITTTILSQSSDLHLRGAAFSPNDGLVAVSSDGGHVYIFDIAQNAIIYDFWHEQTTVRSVVFSRSGNELLTGADDGKVRLWDLRIGQLKTTLVHFHDVVTSLKLTGDLLVTTGADGRIFVSDINDTWHCSLTITEGSIWDATLSGAPSLLFAATDEGLYRIDYKTCNALSPVIINEGPIRTVQALGNPEQTLLTTSLNGQVTIADHTGNIHARFTTHKADLTGNAISGDGTLLITISTDRMARVYPLASPTILEILGRLSVLRGR